MAGLPSLVTNFGAAEYLPGSVVFKIQPGESEAAEIRTVIEKLAGSRTRHPLGAEFAQEHFDAKIVAAELLMIFERSAPYLKEVNAQWDKVLSNARLEILREARSFVEEAPSNYQKGDGLFKSAHLQWNSLIEPGLRELGWVSTT